jgi:hypothetical protein
MKKLLLSVAAMLFFAVFMSSCSKDDAPEPDTVLELTVKSDDGLAMSGVNVTLYSSLEDWKNEQNPVQVGLTDASGVAKLKGLEVKTYYINAAKGSYNNWESVFTSVVTAGMTTTKYETIVKMSRSGFLSTAAGKKWRYTSIKQNGVEYIDAPELSCIRDDVYTFSKNAKFEFSEGPTKCSSSAPSTVTGEWSISGDLLAIKEGSETDYTTILQLNESTFKFSADNLEFTMSPI